LTGVVGQAAALAITLATVVSVQAPRPDGTGTTFVLDCRVWSNNSVRTTAQDVTAWTVDVAAASLLV
jgi:hypothetical protein